MNMKSIDAYVGSHKIFVATLTTSSPHPRLYPVGMSMISKIPSLFMIFFQRFGVEIVLKIVIKLLNNSKKIYK